MKRAVNQPTSDLVLFGGIFLKTYRAPDRGMLIPQHAHAFDHLTLLIAGTMRVWTDGRMLGDFVAPATIKIVAEEKHSFLTMTPGVVFACVHAIGEAEDVTIAAEHHLPLEN